MLTQSESSRAMAGPKKMWTTKKCGRWWKTIFLAMFRCTTNFTRSLCKSEKTGAGRATPVARNVRWGHSWRPVHDAQEMGAQSLAGGGNPGGVDARRRGVHTGLLEHAGATRKWK